MKFIEGAAKRKTMVGDGELANGILMCTRSFFYHRDRPTDPTPGFKEPEKQNVVGKIGDVNRCLHGAKKPMLGNGEEGCCAATIEKLQQLMHVQN